MIQHPEQGPATGGRVESERWMSSSVKSGGRSSDPAHQFRRSTHLKHETPGKTKFETHLIEDSEGRLALKLMDVAMDSSLPPTTREAFVHVRQQLVLELSDSYADEAFARTMKASSDHTGIVRSVHKFVPSVEEDSSYGRCDQNAGGPNAFEKTPDMMIRWDDVECHSHLDWEHILTFGVVHLTHSADSRDCLLGQVIQYDVSGRESSPMRARRSTEIYRACRRFQSEHKERHPIVGRSHFTLCGSLLRLWYTDAASFGTSFTSFSSADPADHGPILDIIAFLSDPQEQICK